MPHKSVFILIILFTGRIGRIMSEAPDNLRYVGPPGLTGLSFLQGCNYFHGLELILQVGDGWMRLDIILQAGFIYMGFYNTQLEGVYIGDKRMFVRPE